MEPGQLYSIFLTRYPTGYSAVCPVSGYFDHARYPAGFFLCQISVTLILASYPVSGLPISKEVEKLYVDIDYPACRMRPGFFAR